MDFCDASLDICQEAQYSISIDRKPVVSHIFPLNSAENSCSLRAVDWQVQRFTHLQWRTHPATSPGEKEPPMNHCPKQTTFSTWLLCLHPKSAVLGTMGTQELGHGFHCWQSHSSHLLSMPCSADAGVCSTVPPGNHRNWDPKIIEAIIQI